MPPPYTPSNLSPSRSLSPPAALEVNAAQDTTMSFDLRGLDYVSPVDENLLCPICHVALIDPIVTKCEHVFCKDCFDQAWESSRRCPIDRSPLRVPEDINRAQKIVLNQLDSLLVRCPNAGDGCDKAVSRAMVAGHVDKYCAYTLVPCGKHSCDGYVKRSAVESACMHWITQCPDCNESLMQLDLHEHQILDCAKRAARCESCGTEYLRCEANAHEEACAEVIAACRWARYGCQHTSKRKDLIPHYTKCGAMVVGQIIESLEKRTTDLEAEKHLLNEKSMVQERRIKFLETEKSMLGLSTSSSSSAALPSFPIRDMVGLVEGDDPEWQQQQQQQQQQQFDEPLREQYPLSLLESVEGKVDQLSQSMTELEAKQTMMLFNETIPIKEQLAELRSAQGLVSMHVRWLMNFRLKERRPTAAPPGAADHHHVGSDVASRAAAGPSEAPYPIRRLSDSTREHITKL